MKNTLFPSDSQTREYAQQIYGVVADLPIISPHGHVDPNLLLENKPFGNPAELFIYFDHYITRLLHANGIDLDVITRSATDAKKAWQIFFSNWHIFAGTNSGYWLSYIFENIFEITDTPSAENAMEIYEKIQARLNDPAFLPRNLIKKFKIEFLATTDDPIDNLEAHKQLNGDSTFSTRIAPTFRPDKYLDPRLSGWANNVKELLFAGGNQPTTYDGYIAALENRRQYFIAAGAVSADHGVEEPYTVILNRNIAENLFLKAINGNISDEDAREFAGHMLSEMARMSCEDGLVMTLHAGVVRNHHFATFAKHGADTGHDLPIKSEFVRNLRPLLNAYGNHENLNLILFTLDETLWGREIAPLAGFYRSVLIGAPWWFLDAPKSIIRFREATVEVAGFYRGSGFIDDTRAFLSIPARHDMARRIDAVYLATLVAEGRISLSQAKQISLDLVTTIPKKAFKL
jgi:glucuronate isomerase